MLVDFLRSLQKQMYQLMKRKQELHAGGLRVKRAASGTAKFTMHMRYLAHCLGFGPDDLAHHFLPLFWRSEWPEEWERVYTTTLVLCFREHGRLPTEETSLSSEVFAAEVRAGVQDGSFGIGYLQCRTCYFDAIVSAHAQMAQLVVLGAGFDTRCYRLERRPSRCFEVDAPTTQAEKLEVLHEVGVDASHVTFVAVDFANEDWMANLCNAGFDPSLPTLFLWEGVTYYLSDDVIDITMRHIASCACARVAFDVYHAWYSRHPLTVSFMAKGYGEPFASGVDVGHEGAPAARAGMEIVEVIDSHCANQLYGPRNAAGGLLCPAFGAFAMVVAGTNTVTIPFDTPRLSEVMKVLSRTTDECRWLYALEWADAAAHAAPSPSKDVALHMLIVGSAIEAGLPPQHSVQCDDGGENLLTSRRWDAVVLSASLRQRAGGSQAELPVIATTLRLLQAHSGLSEPSPVWVCTAGTHATAATSQCAHSGLWGLARACRQELPQLPAWCVDVQHVGLHHILSSVLHSRTLRLPSGSVRGLRLSSSIEPEAALMAATLRVPRLVAPYFVQATALAASVASMHRQLDVHTSREMAGLDARRLSRAYALLEALCQQHVSGAVQTIRQTSVPMWHHKLLLAWCAGQSPPLSDGAVTPADVRAAHPDL